jgi:hypothetical protein
VSHSRDRVIVVANGTLGAESTTVPLRSPEWWAWELVFTGHAELRLEERGVSEVDVHTMPDRPTAIEANAAAGRFSVQASHRDRRWIVILEPDVDATLLVVVTVYEELP